MAESECFSVDIGPEHIQLLNSVLHEYRQLLESSLVNTSVSKNQCSAPCDCDMPSSPSQHYRDDLRAGAFQFIEASDGTRFTQELPLPYQVIFWCNPPTMAWRYPQPRTLTRVDIFPVPYKMATSCQEENSNCKEQVLCSLQYWSDTQNCYQEYSQFKLSESDMCHLKHPDTCRPVVSCTWRVQLVLQSGYEDSSTAQEVSISPHSLAACMRVDSFFSPELVPCLQVALKGTSIRISFYNHVQLDSFLQTMPEPMQPFSWDGALPNTQCFLSTTFDGISVLYSEWTSKMSVTEVKSNVRSDAVDFAYLTEQCLVEPFSLNLKLMLADSKSISLVTSEINIRVGPSMVHSLGIASQLWGSANSKILEQPCIIVSRYIICNDLMQPIRFGQVNTDEDIFLGSRQCHMYAWRTQKLKHLLHVGTENGAWVWSKPFSIHEDSIIVSSLEEDGQKEFNIIVKVTSLSSTQKQVIICGQLSVTNLMAENFECNVVQLSNNDPRSSPTRSFFVYGQDTAPSIVISNSDRIVLRIRLHGIQTSWSGDIPLEENLKTSQPWLVKVPLQDRKQFLSVWCRIFRQQIGNDCRILAVLSPLYVIRSNLPVSAKVFIDTPGLKVHLESVVRGKGEKQQLYCPGTVEHSHKLTFQLENSVSPSDPYVPLSYTMVDRQNYQKKFDVNGVDIENILKTVHSKENVTWPFVSEEYEGLSWSVAQQPQTHVQVKYKLQDPCCNTLIVDLQPWALIVNTAGVAVSLFVENNFVCNIPNLGVVAPPTLENTFMFVFQLKTSECLSHPLHLEQTGQKNTFYMPRISGVIPAEGNVSIPMQFSDTMCFACLKSNIVEEIKVLHIRPGYIVCNRTSLDLLMSSFVLRNKITKEEFNQATQFFISLVPETNDKNKGVPITEWTLLGEEDKNLVHCVSFSMGSGWCRPLKVNSCFARQSFTIPVAVDEKSIKSNKAFVLAAQECDSQVFLHIYEDPHPQILINNKCNFKLACAQGNDGNTYREVDYIDWNLEINPNCSAYFTLPSVYEHFPNIGRNKLTPLLVLAHYTDVPLKWSQGLNINEVQEQFLYLPNFGDVKVYSELHCHTMHVTVDTVSHVEISARDIRTRLMQSQENRESSPEKFSRKNVHTTNGAFSKFKETGENSAISAATSNFDNDLTRSLSDAGSVKNLWHCEMKTDTSSKTKLKSECKNDFSMALFMKGLNFTLTEDLPGISSSSVELLYLSLDSVCVSVLPQKNLVKTEWNMCLLVGDVQLDNQMFQSGGFDFPVILMGQMPNRFPYISMHASASSLIEQVKGNALLKVMTAVEKHSTVGLVAKSSKISISPLSLYLEDNLKRRLIDNTVSFLNRGLFLATEGNQQPMQPTDTSDCILVPISHSVDFQAQQIAFPIRMQSFIIEPLSLLLSLHMTVPLYIALDHSPLQFSEFEQRWLITTPYRLGQTLTIHYLSGAIFGAGWVVGSLELLGSPGGFARTVGNGLRDFVNLPFQGIFQGPWAFISGITHGSASLMKHVTAGTLTSVTKLAGSLARNLDRLTLDTEHLERTEERRRQPPQGLAEGVMQGLTGLGISLLGAVGGIAHHPLQSVLFGGSLAAGVGRGLVGIVTKPLSGAAELVSLAGQGLLHGTGWSTVLQVRHQPLIDRVNDRVSSHLKYFWKLIPNLRHPFLLVIEAMQQTDNGLLEAVTLSLTTHALFLISVEHDTVERVLALSEITSIEKQPDPTRITICFRQTAASVEMDEVSRARVVEFVQRSGAVVNGNSDRSPSDSRSCNSSPILEAEPPCTHTAFTFYVNPQLRNYFVSVLTVAKRQCQGRGFPVL